MVEHVDQAKRKESANESCTLWLPFEVIQDLNELVAFKSNRSKVVSRSGVVADLIRREHKKEAARAK